MRALMSIATAAEIDSFWREAGRERWFKKNDEFDLTIKSKFLATHAAAALGKLGAWEDNAQGALALVIVLDQFSRNMFRGTAQAFAADPSARAVANRAIAHGFDRATERALRPFFLSTLHALGTAGRSGSLHAALRSAWRSEAVKIRRNSSRYHREVRAISASQPRAWPRHDAGRARVFGWRRLRGIAAPFTSSPPRRDESDRPTRRSPASPPARCRD